tara:strand:- start:26 stop:559 length:534 start_codon:yes stop_codon:yes gene_type:complete
MSGFITRQNLLLLAGVLVLMRFIFLPVLSWQNEKIESVRLKAKQLDKLDSILARQDAYVEQRVLIDQAIVQAKGVFFSDNGKTKLTIQKKIEEIFKVNNVSIQGFSWVFDESDDIRTLRATLRYQGALKDIVRVFLDMSQIPQVVREVSWRQSIRGGGSDTLGDSTGDITVEFYAVN